MSPAEPRIALVAATHKRPDALATLLASLARQTMPRDQYEAAIVVDGLDESEPAYRAVIERSRREHGVAFREAFQQNAGQSVARNRAIRMTQAPYLVIVDDDMDLAPEFLAAHVAALEAQPDTVVIGRVIPEEGWERQPLYEAVRTKAMLELHDGIASGVRPAVASALVTQNVALPRALYDRVGGLDEHLRLGEDTELGYRLEVAGARFAFAPQAAAVHRSRVGSYETWLRRQIAYGRNAVYVFEKLNGELRAHPLRNLVNGSKLNALAVHALCWSDRLGSVGIGSLRLLGNALQGAGRIDLAIATHKAILAIAYHLGVRDALGSWGALRAAERAFAATPGRPTDPT